MFQFSVWDILFHMLEIEIKNDIKGFIAHYLVYVDFGPSYWWAPLLNLYGFVKSYQFIANVFTHLNIGRYIWRMYPGKPKILAAFWPENIDCWV